MKTLKAIAIASVITLASAKIFAQSTDTNAQKPEKTDAAGQEHATADNDPVSDFFKRYQVYIKNQKAAQRRPVATDDKTVSHENVNKALEALQTNANLLSAVTPANGSASTPEFAGLTSQNTQLNSNYLEARGDYQRSMTAPPARPVVVELTVNEKENMLKKALSDMEKLNE